MFDDARRVHLCTPRATRVSYRANHTALGSNRTNPERSGGRNSPSMRRDTLSTLAHLGVPTWSYTATDRAQAPWLTFAVVTAATDERESIHYEAEC